MIIVDIFIFVNIYFFSSNTIINSVNFIPRSSMSSELFGKEISSVSRFFMLIAFAVTFSSLISAFWIFFVKYSTEKYTLWVGFVLLIQTVLIFVR